MPKNLHGNLLIRIFADINKKQNVMFTQKCFIRKNTPEIVNALEQLGYGTLFSARNGYGEYLCCYNSIVTGSDGGEINYEFIDCGTNEELFLAIAALRDDSDKFQYFTNGVFWIKCSQLELKHELDNNYEEFCVADFHKATVQELIEHFNK